ncbi:caspase family protein [Aquabacterium sp.]|uniref:caspase family protein n=1 Tax=Aquabacterium sp. TaxID=1872578 RepID=UPI0037843FAA
MPEPAPRYEAFLQLDTGTHHGEIIQLAATRDGQRLVSAGETTIRVWHAQTRTLERLLLGQVSGITDDAAADGLALRFAISPDGRWVAAIKPWNRRALAERVVGRAAHHHRYDDGLEGDDLGRVTELQLFDLATGNLRARHVHPGLLLDLDFSPDGRWLVMAGNVREGRGRRASVALLGLRDWLKAGTRGRAAWVETVTVGRAQRCAWLPVGLRCVPAGPGPTPRGPARLVLAMGEPMGADGEVAWLAVDAKGRLRADRLVRTEVPINPPTLAVSAAMAVVAAGPLGGRRRLGQLLCHAHDSDACGAIGTESPPASAAFSPAGTQLVAGFSVDRVNGLDVAPGDQVVQVNAYAVLPTGAGLELRSSYYGHDGTVYAAAWLDEATAVTAGGDNHAIHLWRPEHRVGTVQAAIRGVGQTLYAPGITRAEQVLFGTVPQRLLPPRHPARQQAFCLRTMRLLTTAASSLRQSDYESRKWFIMDQSAQVVPLRYSPDAYGDALDLPPDLSLFVGADDEWVIWSRSGYYDASPNGAQRIGYRVNRGPDQEALFVPSDRFKQFYRPDIIAAIVRHGSEDRARSMRLPIAPIEVAKILPPIIELLPGGARVGDGEVHLHFSVECPNPDEPVTRLWILRNDRFVWVETQPKRQPRAEYRVSLPLRPGPNLISLRAENAQARAVPVVLQLTGPVPDEPDARARLDAPGRLFMLSVGVSDFAAAGTPEAGPFQPLRFAHRDALAVFNAFARSAPGHAAHATLPLKNAAFEAVEAAVLVNEAATKQAILAELDRLCARIRERHRAAGAERDVLFVFLSGHGVRYQGEPELYFWNHDLRPQAMESTGLSMLDLGDRITAVPAEVVLVVDACHSAMAGSGVMSGLDAEELARRVHAINERGMYLLNAARSEEKAREDPTAGLGVFTGAMLETLRSQHYLQPEAPGSTRRSLAMAALIAGVQQLLPQITARAGVQAQTPVCRIYGDLLPLTIYKTDAGGAALRRAGASRKVPAAGAARASRGRNSGMATKTAAAKQAPAKKAAVKKAAVKKTAPAKKTPARARPQDGGKGGADIVRQAPEDK